MIKKVDIELQKGTIESDYYALELSVDKAIFSDDFSYTNLTLRLSEFEYQRLKDPEKFMKYLRQLLLRSMLCDGSCYSCREGEPCSDADEFYNLINKESK
tara:strand:+ start:73 stop:372 length:300 start_codon:yes stop_codon:yes gene_type:complete